MTLVGLGYLDQQEKRRHNAATEAIDRSKILSNERISSLDRDSREKIADADRLSRENIAGADRDSRERVSELDRQSREHIAVDDRNSRETMALKDRTAKTADSRYASDAKLVGQSVLKNAAASAIVTDRVLTGDWSSGPTKASYMKQTTENSLNAASSFLNSFQDAILGKTGSRAKRSLQIDSLSSAYK